MEPVVRDFNGIIDKYIGDGILALFPNGVDDAIQAASKMLSQVELFNIDRKKQQLFPIEIGIGLHYGPMVLGTIGTDQRMEATVISDVVNTASRIEEMTKDFQSSLLMSMNFWLEISKESLFRCRMIDTVRIRGKARPITIFEVLDHQDPVSAQIKYETRVDFERGINHFNKRRYEAAEKIFAHIYQLNPHDQSCKNYLDRCCSYLSDNDVA